MNKALGVVLSAVLDYAIQACGMDIQKPLRLYEFINKQNAVPVN